MPDSQEDDEEGGINITLGKLIAYPVGLLVLLLSLAAFISSFVAGLVLLAAGLIALPIVRSRVKKRTGVRLNRWAASAIVIVLVVAGVALIPAADDGGGTMSANNGGQTELISQSSAELVPTIEDFESGWRGSATDNGTAQYYNVETDESVLYNVTVHDTIEDAESELQRRSPENTATKEVDIGDGGYLYPITDRTYIVQFQQQNVVCETTYRGGMATLDREGSAEDLAQRCANAIGG